MKSRAVSLDMACVRAVERRLLVERLALVGDEARRDEDGVVADEDGEAGSMQR